MSKELSAARWEYLKALPPCTINYVNKTGRMLCLNGERQQLRRMRRRGLVTSRQERRLRKQWRREGFLT